MNSIGEKIDLIGRVSRTCAHMHACNRASWSHHATKRVQPCNHTLVQPNACNPVMLDV